jgi:hypothetical protein
VIAVQKSIVKDAKDEIKHENNEKQVAINECL